MYYLADVKYDLQREDDPLGQSFVQNDSNWLIQSLDEESEEEDIY